MVVSDLETGNASKRVRFGIVLVAMAGWSGLAMASTITINIKIGASGPKFDDQAQKIVRAKNKAGKIIWHCNACDASQPLSVSFTDCLDPQHQLQACPANPHAESDRKSVFDVDVATELEDGTLNYVIKVGEQEVDPSIIVTR